jgi:hypothetical protein
MAEHKTVMISSTILDLPEHREEVRSACEEMGMFPSMMEYRPASDKDAILFSLSLVDDADIYVGVYAHRYGYVPTGHKISITEMEYKRAIERKIPRLIFVMHKDHSVKAVDVDRGDSAQKLEMFKQRAQSENVVRFFKSPADLRAHVVAALAQHRAAGVTGTMVHQLLASPEDFAGREPEAPRSKLTAHRVADCADPDIRRALDIYDRRIPEYERFEAIDIVRWLREGQEDRQAGKACAVDYFVIAKKEEKVCGFILLHYYPSAQLAFVAYLVAEKGVAHDYERISQELLREVVRLFEKDESLKQCKGFLFEADDPTRCALKERRERLARIRLFCLLAEPLGFSLRALDFDYLPPPLSIPGREDAPINVPMLLIYARKASLIAGDDRLKRAEVVGLLEFIYKSLYPEGFSDIAIENLEYRRYLEGLCEDQIARIPDEVRMLPFREVHRRVSRLPALQADREKQA